MQVDIGKKFEKGLTKCFDALCQSHLVKAIRFQDTHDTRGTSFLKAYPSDYLVCLPKGSGFTDQVVYFEAKASRVKTNLSKSMLRPSQIQGIHTYAGLLKIPYIVAFWSAKNGDMQFWNGLDLLNKGRPFLTVDLHGVEEVNVSKLTETLKSIFLPPSKEITIKGYHHV